jgi:exopolyphosphatase / guanosine-5'-triphosphate,3'-diphosphate pyrophosphatase
MNLAIIDMGTNTFHLLLVAVNGTSFDVVHKEKVAVKIGENGINEGLINEEAIERCLKTITAFKEKIVAANISEVFAIGTSALRNALNGQQVIDRIKKEVGLNPRIISGIEEATYIHYGVSKALQIGPEISLIMDIGGGSIEFIIANAHEPLWMESFEIGGQRMLEKFHKTDPIEPAEIKELKIFLERNLTSLFEACEKFKPTTLIGSSGTFDTLSEIQQLKTSQPVGEKVTELPMTLSAFKEIFSELIIKNKEERMAIPGMIALRVDMIVVASVLIEFILSKLNLTNIRISSYSLKEGVLIKTIEEHIHQNTSPTYINI